MSYKKYLLILAGACLIGWFSFWLVITKLEPCTGPGSITLCHSVSTSSLLFFFLSAFFALTATCTILGFLLRIWLHRYEVYLDHLNISMRQGLLLSICALAAIGLLPLHALTWWTSFLLIGSIVLIEFYFSRL